MIIVCTGLCLPLILVALQGPTRQGTFTTKTPSRMYLVPKIVHATPKLNSARKATGHSSSCPLFYTGSCHEKRSSRNRSPSSPHHQEAKHQQGMESSATTFTIVSYCIRAHDTQKLNAARESASVPPLYPLIQTVHSCHGKSNSAQKVSAHSYSYRILFTGS